VAGQPKADKRSPFWEDKLSRVHDPHVAPLNALVEAWRREGRDVPWVDPDLGGVHSRILFLHESPGPASSTGHGSAIISPDNNDQTAGRFRRLSGEAGLDPRTYLNWNVVPWYVSATGKAVNATSADGAAALPYLHRFVLLLTELRVVVVMGGFAERWWLQYLRQLESPVLPLICAPHPSASARRSRPGFEADIAIAMAKARHTAKDDGGPQLPRKPVASA
jgi:uracil-DNA glycosylase